MPLFSPEYSRFKRRVDPVPPEPRQLEPQKARGKMSEDLWKNDNWIAELKFDGCRYLLHLNEEGLGSLTSRRQSVKDTGFVNKGANFPHLVSLKLEDTVLDGEIISGLYDNSYEVTTISGSSPERAVLLQKANGFLHYMVFDILFYRGEDVRGYDLLQRKKFLRDAVDQLDSEYIHYTAAKLRDKFQFYRRAIERGGEGIILKNLYAQYGTHKSWVKMKKVNTWDCIVTGFIPAEEVSIKKGWGKEYTPTKYKGQIGAITLSQYKGKTLVEVASISGFDDAQRLDMTRHPEAYLGRVVEIEAQERLPSNRFRHPRFFRWRTDKDAKDCTLDG